MASEGFEPPKAEPADLQSSDLVFNLRSESTRLQNRKGKPPFAEMAVSVHFCQLNGI